MGRAGQAGRGRGSSPGFPVWGGPRFGPGGGGGPWLSFFPRGGGIGGGRRGPFVGPGCFRGGANSASGEVGTPAKPVKKNSPAPLLRGEPKPNGAQLQNRTRDQRGGLKEDGHSKKVGGRFSGRLDGGTGPGLPAFGHSIRLGPPTQARGLDVVGESRFGSAGVSGLCVRRGVATNGARAGQTTQGGPWGREGGGGRRPGGASGHQRFPGSGEGGGAGGRAGKRGGAPRGHMGSKRQVGAFTNRAGGRSRKQRPYLPPRGLGGKGVFSLHAQGAGVP